MALISTKELFENFFSTVDDETVRKTRRQTDRPEVYAFEKKIGKELLDMNYEEIEQMVLTFRPIKAYEGAERTISNATRRKVFSDLRRMFDYYSQNYEPIWNPLRDKEARGFTAEMRYMEKRARFDWPRVENVIAKFSEVYGEKRAKYTECIILLFYNGFETPKEIAELKRENIDFRNKVAKLPGRTVKLSDRCFELLNYVHNLELMDEDRIKYYMESWNDSYFKFAITAHGKTMIERDLKDITTMITSILTRNVAKYFDPEINFRNLFNLGFYDFFVKKYGEERTREMLLTNRDTKYADEIMATASEYGVFIRNVTYIKRKLMPYIR